MKKTKEMIIDRDGKTPQMDIRIDQSQVEQVDKYVYLGHIISNNGTCEMEIKRRIEIARSKFIELKGILTSREIPVSVRVQLTRTLIWSVLLYGAEAQTLNAGMVDKLEAFEMWLYRRILKISWVQKRTNEEVLQLAC